MNGKATSLIISLLLSAALVSAKNIQVPAEFSTLKEAVSAAANGDTVLLAPGVYSQSKLLRVDKAITLASNFIHSRLESDIDNTIIRAASDDLEEWFELAAENSQVIGITFQGNGEHTFNITASFATVAFCKFFGGKDQLSISDGGGYIGNCYFESAGDDGIDCDNSINWIIEYNTIVNAHQDGIEIRLHPKEAPMTIHIFRYNRIIGAGQSGIQLIDYQGDSHRTFYIHNNIFKDCRGAGFSSMYQEKDNTNEKYKGSLMMETAFIYNNPIHYDADVSLGENNIIDVDPMLGKDFTLNEKSVCIDKGVSEFQWKKKTLSISKENYIGSAPDIGAIEYGQAQGTRATRAVVHAGEDIVLIAPNNQTMLRGLVTGVDAENQLTFCWRKLSGPGAVKFADSTALETMASFSHQGVYELELTGSSSEFSTSDLIKVFVVRDFVDRSVQVGKNQDAYIEAEDYRFIVGPAAVTIVPGARGKLLKFEGKEAQAFAQYQVSTQSPGPYYVWIRLTGKADDQCDLAVSFNQLQNEESIKVPPNADSNKFHWQSVAFANVPEGIFPLRIRAIQTGAAWDTIFITCDENKKPLN